jgi:hypothetical protein
LLRRRIKTFIQEIPGNGPAINSAALFRKLRPSDQGRIKIRYWVDVKIPHHIPLKRKARTVSARFALHYMILRPLFKPSSFFSWQVRVMSSDAKRKIHFGQFEVTDQASNIQLSSAFLDLNCVIARVVQDITALTYYLGLLPNATMLCPC